MTYGKGLGPRETVGRRREIEQIEHAVRRTAAGRATAVAITGTAGIGKSRLVDHLLAGAADEGWPTRLLRAGDSIEDLDLLWAELAGGSPDRSDLDHGVIDGSDPAPLVARRARQLSLLVDALVEQASSPLAVVIDDAHDASPTLIAFIDQLSRRLRQMPSLPLLVGVGARPTPGDSPVGRAIDELITFSGCVHLDVGPLTEAEEADLIRREVGAPTPTYLGVVRRASGGNPLRSRTMVGLLQQMQVPPTLEAGDESASLRVELAEGSDDPVTAWLTGLPTPVQTVLGAGAVLAGGFGPTDISPLLVDADLDRDSVEDGLWAAVDVGCLVSDGSRFWFAHHLYRDAANGLTPGPRRRALHHRRAAVLLESAAPEDGTNWLTIGRHLLTAGDTVGPTIDPTVMVRAGRAALEIGEWFESAQLLRRALSAGAGPGLAPRERASALHLCGLAHFFAHDLGGAVEVLSEMIDLAGELDDHDLLADALRLRLWAVNNLDAEAYRRPPDLTEYLAAVDRLDRPDLQAGVLHACAESLITAGRLAEGREVAERAVQLAKGRSAAPIEAACTYALGYAELTAGRVRTAVPALFDAVRLARRSGDWYVESALTGRLAFAHLGAGDLDRAQNAAERSLEQAGAHNEHSGQALGGSILATVALLAGDARLARAHLADARLATERSSYRGADLFLGPVEVIAALREADTDGASSALDHWPALPGVLRRELEGLISVYRPTSAGPELPPMPRWQENQVAIGALAIDLQAALLAGDRARLGQLDDLVEPLRRGEIMHPPMAPFALDRLLGELDLAMGRPTEGAVLLGRAAERLRAAGATAELALTILAQARAAAELDSSPDGARRLAARAAELLDQVGMVTVRDEAVAFAGAGADARDLVERRGGDWTVILVTDVVGSTEISARYGDVLYHDLIMAHHDLVRAACRSHGGNERGDSGDGLYFWFADTADALDAALAVQRAVAARQADGPPLAVKISLAGGEPLFRDGRPYGLVLNRAFRVADTATGGQVVVDEAVAETLAPGLIADRFERELRGIGRQSVSVLNAEGGRILSREAAAGEISNMSME